jgi:hypothetical protein
MPLMRFVLPMLRFYHLFFPLKGMLDLRLHTTRGRLAALHNNHRSEITQKEAFISALYNSHIN